MVPRISITQQHFLTYLKKNPLSPGFLDPRLPPLPHIVIPPHHHHHSQLAVDPYSRSCVISWGEEDAKKKNEETHLGANWTAVVSSSQTFARHAAVRVLKAVAEGFLAFKGAGDRCLSAEQRHRLAAGEVGSPERSSPSGLDRRLTGWLAGCGGEKIQFTRQIQGGRSGLNFQNKIL